MTWPFGTRSSCGAFLAAICVQRSEQNWKPLRLDRWLQRMQMSLAMARCVLVKKGRSRNRGGQQDEGRNMLYVRILICTVDEAAVTPRATVRRSQTLTVTVLSDTQPMHDTNSDRDTLEDTHPTRADPVPHNLTRPDLDRHATRTNPKLHTLHEWIGPLAVPRPTTVSRIAFRSYAVLCCADHDQCAVSRTLVPHTR